MATKKGNNTWKVNDLTGEKTLISKSDNVLTNEDAELGSAGGYTRSMNAGRKSAYQPVPESPRAEQASAPSGGYTSYNESGSSGYSGYQPEQTYGYSVSGGTFREQSGKESHAGKEYHRSSEPVRYSEGSGSGQSGQGSYRKSYETPGYRPEQISAGEVERSGYEYGSSERGYSSENSYSSRPYTESTSPDRMERVHTGHDRSMYSEAEMAHSERTVSMNYNPEQVSVGEVSSLGKNSSVEISDGTVRITHNNTSSRPESMNGFESAQRPESTYSSSTSTGKVRVGRENGAYQTEAGISSSENAGSGRAVAGNSSSIGRNSSVRSGNTASMNIEGRAGASVKGAEGTQSGRSGVSVRSAGSRPGVTVNGSAPFAVSEPGSFSEASGYDPGSGAQPSYGNSLKGGAIGADGTLVTAASILNGEVPTEKAGKGAGKGKVRTGKAAGTTIGTTASGANIPAGGIAAGGAAQGVKTSKAGDFFKRAGKGAAMDATQGAGNSLRTAFNGGDGEPENDSTAANSLRGVLDIKAAKKPEGLSAAQQINTINSVNPNTAAQAAQSIQTVQNLNGVKTIQNAGTLIGSANMAEAAASAAMTAAGEADVTAVKAGQTAAQNAKNIQKINKAKQVAQNAEMANMQLEGADMLRNTGGAGSGVNKPSTNSMKQRVNTDGLGGVRAGGKVRQVKTTTGTSASAELKATGRSQAARKSAEKASKAKTAGSAAKKTESASSIGKAAKGKKSIVETLIIAVLIFAVWFGAIFDGNNITVAKASVIPAVANFYVDKTEPTSDEAIDIYNFIESGYYYTADVADDDPKVLIPQKSVDLMIKRMEDYLKVTDILMSKGELKVGKITYRGETLDNSLLAGKSYNDVLLPYNFTGYLSEAEKQQIEDEYQEAVRQWEARADAHRRALEDYWDACDAADAAYDEWCSAVEAYNADPENNTDPGSAPSYYIPPYPGSFNEPKPEKPNIPESTERELDVPVVTMDEVEGSLSQWFSKTDLAIRYAFVDEDGSVMYTDDATGVVATYNRDKLLKAILEMAVIATDNTADYPQAYIDYCLHLIDIAIGAYNKIDVLYGVKIMGNTRETENGKDWVQPYEGRDWVYYADGARLTCEVTVYMNPSVENLAANDDTEPGSLFEGNVFTGWTQENLEAVYKFMAYDNKEFGHLFNVVFAPITATMAGNTTDSKIFNALINSGFSDASAVAIMGWMKYKLGAGADELDPGYVSPDGKQVGLLKFNKDDLEEFAKNYGEVWPDIGISTQIEYMINDMFDDWTDDYRKGSGNNNFDKYIDNYEKGTYVFMDIDSFKKITDPEQAVAAFAASYLGEDFNVRKINTVIGYTTEYANKIVYGSAMGDASGYILEAMKIVNEDANTHFFKNRQGLNSCRDFVHMALQNAGIATDIDAWSLFYPQQQLTNHGFQMSAYSGPNTLQAGDILAYSLGVQSDGIMHYHWAIYDGEGHILEANTDNRGTTAMVPFYDWGLTNVFSFMGSSSSGSSDHTNRTLVGSTHLAITSSDGTYDNTIVKGLNGTKLQKGQAVINDSSIAPGSVVKISNVSGSSGRIVSGRYVYVVSNSVDRSIAVKDGDPVMYINYGASKGQYKESPYGSTDSAEMYVVATDVTYSDFVAKWYNR